MNTSSGVLHRVGVGRFSGDGVDDESDVGLVAKTFLERLLRVSVAFRSPATLPRLRSSSFQAFQRS
jgi:hypothetical protein